MYWLSGVLIQWYIDLVVYWLRVETETVSWFGGVLLRSGGLMCSQLASFLTKPPLVTMQCVFQGWLWYNATNEVLADEFLECPNKYPGVRLHAPGGVEAVDRFLRGRSWQIPDEHVKSPSCVWKLTFEYANSRSQPAATFFAKVRCNAWPGNGGVWPRNGRDWPGNGGIWPGNGRGWPGTGACQQSACITHVPTTFNANPKMWKSQKNRQDSRISVEGVETWSTVAGAGEWTPGVDDLMIWKQVLLLLIEALSAKTTDWCLHGRGQEFFYPPWRVTILKRGYPVNICGCRSNGPKNQLPVWKSLPTVKVSFGSAVGTTWWRVGPIFNHVCHKRLTVVFTWAMQCTRC